MYLSQLFLNADHDTGRRALGDCHLLHATLMRAFPTLPGEPSPRATVGLLYRVESSRGPEVCVLAQSLTEPNWPALPAYWAAEEPKPLDPLYAGIATGQTLAFRLRANPTRKIETKSAEDGTKRNGRRVALVKEDEQINWLRRKGVMGDEGGRCGFDLLTVQTNPAVADVRTIVGDRVHGAWRGNDRDNPWGLVFGSVVFEGRLQVTDADAFRAALRTGIGSGKAFGFGLLSVAPSRASPMAWDTEMTE